MRPMIKAYLVALLLAASPVAAEDFDYYVLALSWTPSFCASGGADGDADAPGFGVHAEGRFEQVVPMFRHFTVDAGIGVL